MEIVKIFKLNLKLKKNYYIRSICSKKKIVRCSVGYFCACNAVVQFSNISRNSLNSVSFSFSDPEICKSILSARVSTMFNVSAFSENDRIICSNEPHRVALLFFMDLNVSNFMFGNSHSNSVSNSGDVNSSSDNMSEISTACFRSLLCLEYIA